MKDLEDLLPNRSLAPKPPAESNAGELQLEEKLYNMDIYEPDMSFLS